ncbi:MAG: hypothetical protein HY277_08115 [Ignavibacteriales bacterium]|nr:hypothetical protein [Ignavibacteriales bacterium]
MVHKGGVLFDAVLSGTDPKKIISDNSWKVRLHPSFITTQQQQQWNDWKWVEYPIVYDARNNPGNWTALSFDDAAWAPASVKGKVPDAPWNLLVHRTIPLLKVLDAISFDNQANLLRSIRIDTTFTADVENNIQGYLYLKVNAPAGDTITIRMNEWYTERYITKEGVQEYITYQWQNTSGQPWSKHCVEIAFTGISGTIQIVDLKFKPAGYNTNFVGTFNCNNSRLNTLWNKCRNTSYVCMRDQFYDCPDRERGQWWGDVSEQILYSFYLYDSRASLLAKKGFRELMNTQKSDGSLYTTAPGTKFHLPDQNLAAVMSIGDYFMYTGDTALVRELYPKISIYIRHYVASHCNSDGMLILQKGVWNWIDWGDNLDVQTGSTNTVVNGLFIRLMETLKLLAKATGNSREVVYYQKLQDEARKHFNEYFWNRESRAYVFYTLQNSQSKTIDDRSNAWAVLAGVVDSSRQDGVLDILNTKLYASPYQERYIEDAMFVMGKDSAAIARMLNYYQPDIDSWSQTMWERMGNNSTNNHAWAASPCYLLGAYVAGIKPTAPGFSSYQVLPMLGPLTALSATVPSMKGTITTIDSLFTNKFTLELSSPSGSQAVVGIPRKCDWKSVSVNGKIIWDRGAFLDNVAGISGAGTDNRYIKFNVDPGMWKFTALLTL